MNSKYYYRSLTQNATEESVDKHMHTS